jgi:hypothetical protein
MQEPFRILICAYTPESTVSGILVYYIEKIEIQTKQKDHRTNPHRSKVSNYNLQRG